MTTPMAKAMTDLESENVNIVQVRDIAEAQRFYEEVLGCLKGPGGEQWLDLNLYGRPVVCRLNPQLGKEGRVGSHYHLVQGKYVPVSHCCVVLELRKWRSIVKRLKQHRVKFVIERYRHSKNTAGAQATLFLLDPSGNALEVQSFCNSAAELLRCELQRALAGWMPWAIVTAFIVGCILLVPKKSEDEIAAGHFAVSAHLPPCANVGACLR
jgi:extradiol dioxygenase family protein